MKHMNSALVLAAAAGLAACGGGSGGSDTVAAADPVTISAANAEEVAGTAYDAGASLEGAGLGGAGLVTPAAVGGAAAGGVDMIEVIVGQLQASESWFAGSGTVSAAATTSQSQACSEGSVSFTFNDADGDGELSSGDSMSATYYQCVEGDTVLNGGFSISNIVISGDPSVPPYSLQLTIQASNFTATANGETSSLHGGMTLSLTTDGVSSSVSVSGSSIIVSGAGGNAALSSFVLQSTHDESSGAYTLKVDAIVSSSEIGGSVTIVTDIRFEAVEPGDPYQGRAIITGADNTSVTLVAMSDGVTVQLLVDEDGDGIPDETLQRTWNDL
ncbi:MAG: hypothetical protein PVI91_04770 [Gammaproteobacteria bacterium]|jgi:hypothetical protein